MSEVAVTNSTCLIALERINRLELLSSSFHQILIPPQVQSEVDIKSECFQVKNVHDINLLKALRLQIDEG